MRNIQESLGGLIKTAWCLLLCRILFITQKMCFLFPPPSTSLICLYRWLNMRGSTAKLSIPAIPRGRGVKNHHPHPLRAAQLAGPSVWMQHPVPCAVQSAGILASCAGPLGQRLLTECRIGPSSAGVTPVPSSTFPFACATAKTKLGPHSSTDGLRGEKFGRKAEWAAGRKALK